jgi:hypothetical protein
MTCFSHAPNMEVKKNLIGYTFAKNEFLVPRFLATFAIQIY